MCSFLSLPPEIHLQIALHLVPEFPEPPSTLKTDASAANVKRYLKTLSKHRYYKQRSCLAKCGLVIINLASALGYTTNPPSDALRNGSGSEKKDDLQTPIDISRLYMRCYAHAIKKYIGTIMIFQQRNRVTGKIYDLKLYWWNMLRLIYRQMHPQLGIDFWKTFLSVWDNDQTFPIPRVIGKGWCSCWDPVNPPCYLPFCYELQGTEWDPDRQFEMRITNGAVLGRTCYYDPDDHYGNVDTEKDEHLYKRELAIAVTRIVWREDGNVVLDKGELDMALLELDEAKDYSLVALLLNRAAKRSGAISRERFEEEFDKFYKSCLGQKLKFAGLRDIINDGSANTYEYVWDFGRYEEDKKKMVGLALNMKLTEDV